MNDARVIFTDCLKLFEPRKRIRPLSWFEEYTYTHEGRPYDSDAYPHIGAPGGPCDALEDDQVTDIWLQWASRLGKTFFGQCALMRQADVSPCTMMFASEAQKTAVEVVQRTYAMIGHCPRLKGQLRPEYRRKQDQVDLANCRIHVGWARSVGTLSDKGIRVGHANEIDKWEHESTSKEADPLKLFDDRFKEFLRFKRIKESTPTLKRSSRVEHGRLNSTNCQYHVPCPHCGRYQVLRMGDGVTPGGIMWEKLDGIKSDKELAWRTARYVCEFCRAEIGDEYRPRMMRAGVWVPEGTQVVDEAAAEAAERRPSWQGWATAEWISGTPARDGRSAGYQLSSLYALSLTWGDIASEFVDSKSKPQNLRNFVNQWLGETWEIVERKQTWEQLGSRLIVDVPRGTVPVWASLLTCGVDRQQDRFVYVVDAWGPGRRNHTVQYGESPSLDEIRGLVTAYWPHEDEGEKLRIALTLIDSGYRPQGVYDFCRAAVGEGFQVWPCKGSAKSLDADVRLTTLGPNTSMPGMNLWHIDTIRSQAWMDHVLHDLTTQDEGGASLHYGSKYEHQDFLEQMLNDAAVLSLDATNHDREAYERVDTALPNDFRDCRRYSYGAMMIVSRGGTIPRRAEKPQARPTVVSTGVKRRSDGRIW